MAILDVSTLDIDKVSQVLGGKTCELCEGTFATFVLVVNHTYNWVPYNVMKGIFP